MANSTIITQSEAVEVKFAFSAIVENFVKHINQDLSSAHGINLAWGDTVGGTDYSKYYDLNGDLVGDYQVCFTDATGSKTYAPAKLSTRDSKPLGTNNTDIVSYSNSEVDKTALATEIVAYETEQINAVLQSWFLPHTKLHAADTHQGCTITSEETFDSNGDKVGTQVATIVVDGAVYKIPGYPVIGGLPVPPSLLGADIHDSGGPRSFLWIDRGGSGEFDTECVIARGRLPITVTLEYSPNQEVGPYAPLTSVSAFAGIRPRTGLSDPYTNINTSGQAVITSLPHTLRLKWDVGADPLPSGYTTYTRVTLVNTVAAHSTVPVSNTMVSQEDDKYVCGYALATGEVTLDEYAQSVRTVKRFYGKTYLLGYRSWARPFVAWAKKHASFAKLVALAGRYHIQGLNAKKRNPLWIAFELVQFSFGYAVGLIKRYKW